MCAHPTVKDPELSPSGSGSEITQPLLKPQPDTPENRPPPDKGQEKDSGKEPGGVSKKSHQQPASEPASTRVSPDAQHQDKDMETSLQKRSQSLTDVHMVNMVNGIGRTTCRRLSKSEHALMDSLRRRRICMEEVAPSMSNILDQPSPQWRLSLDLFSSKKRRDPKEDKKLPRRLRRYYKAQDELISAFEEMQLEVDDAMDNAGDQVANVAEIMAKVTFFLNLVILIGKAVAAGLTGSLSIISALLDSVVDLISGALMWWSNRAMKKRDPYEYPQGRTKLEPIAIVILSVVMALASVQMIRESIEKIIGIALGKASGPSMGIPAIVICCFTVVTKLVLFIVCKRIKNPTTQVLAQDHRNDVLSNTVALAGGLIGARLWPYADPSGALLISFYIIASWYFTGWEQIKMLTGHTARPDFLKKITWIAINHHPKLQFVDTVRAFHFGNNFLVEVDIVLPEDLVLKEAHDIGESLQLRIEKLPEVERAFVHLDYEWEHDPTSEHKQV